MLSTSLPRHRRNRSFIEILQTAVTTFVVLIGGLVGEGEDARALGSNLGAGVTGGSFFAGPGVRLEIDAGDTSSLLRLTGCVEGPIS